MRSMVGGAAVPEALIRKFEQHGVRLAQGWGMTETSPLASLFYEKPELAGKLDEDEWFARKALAGVPVPLVRDAGDCRVRRAVRERRHRRR